MQSQLPDPYPCNANFLFNINMHAANISMQLFFVFIK